MCRQLCWYFKKEGKRMFDNDCFEKEFLLKYLDQEVVQGVCPFLFKAKVYNSVHGYGKMGENECPHENEESVKPKKMR